MDRLKEASTWAGVAGFGSLLATFLPPQWQWVGHVLTGIGSGAAIKLREAGQ